MISHQPGIKVFRRRRRTAASLFVLLQCLFFDEIGCSVRAHTRTKRRRRLSTTLHMEPVTVKVKSSPIRQTQTAHGDWIRLMSDGETATTEDCSEAAGPCEQCTDSERIMIPEACMDTGKRQPFHCYNSSEDHTEPLRTIYHSCARTPDDERFSMMRFQVLCFLAGLVALASVKQQKAAAASLFDQRKLNIQKKRRTSNNPLDIELSSTVAMRGQENKNSAMRQEESKSLLADVSLDIV